MTIQEPITNHKAIRESIVRALNFASLRGAAAYEAKYAELIHAMHPPLDRPAKMGRPAGVSKPKDYHAVRAVLSKDWKPTTEVAAEAGVGKMGAYTALRRLVADGFAERTNRNSSGNAVMWRRV